MSIHQKTTTYDIPTATTLADLGIDRPAPDSMGPDGCNTRVTLRTNEDFLTVLDTLVDAGVFPNRSAAFRRGAERLVDDALDDLEDGGSR